MSSSGILLAGMIGLFALSFGYILIFVLYQRRMIAKELQQQVIETSYQKRLLESAIDNQEAERKRIALDLHDEIGALLTTSKLYVNQLASGRGEEQMKMVNDKINLLFDEMIVNIRRISHDLQPVVLENLGLTEAIESIRDKLVLSGMRFTFTSHLSFRMTPRAELILYRIIQELVNNTLKHASASSINLSLEEQGDQVCIRYQDNGVGFDPATHVPGLGLKSIETRLSLLETSLQTLTSDRGVDFLIRMQATKLAP